MTIVTRENRYVVTVNDWPFLMRIYNDYKKNPTGFNNTYKLNSERFKSAELALFYQFATAMNL